MKDNGSQTPDGNWINLRWPNKVKKNKKKYTRKNKHKGENNE